MNLQIRISPRVLRASDTGHKALFPVTMAHFSTSFFIALLGSEAETGTQGQGDRDGET